MSRSCISPIVLGPNTRFTEAYLFGGTSAEQAFDAIWSLIGGSGEIIPEIVPVAESAIGYLSF
jgi:hypothetical protein